MKTLNDCLKIYIENAIKHGEGIDIGDHKLANRSHDNLIEALHEIIKCDTNGRDALLLLLNHDNCSVRGWAATHSLAYNESLALDTLDELSKEDGLIGFSAEMVIKEWKKGNLKIP